jgi:ABC-2 type transport system ATP-binding protein
MTDPVLEVAHLVKQYDTFRAVDDLSFAVQPGELFGLLGPNGAGKTTTIRAIMDIFKPDSGTIRVLGDLPGSSRARVGYLPEERGLYPDLTLHEMLVYMARLKGQRPQQAHQAAASWLDRVELGARATDRVRDLSRGMQQKVQLLVSLIHRPELVILDEPFQGLDPINVRLVTDIIKELRAEGTTVLLSSHQLHRVEHLCERIVLIHRGQAALYGTVAEIKRRHSPNMVRLQTPTPLASPLPGVDAIEQHDGDYILYLNGTHPQAMLRTLVEREIAVEAFEVASLSLEEIFVRTVSAPAAADGSAQEVEQ